MMDHPAKHQHVELMTHIKLKIMKHFENIPKLTLRSLSKKFSIGKSTVGDIIYKQDVYKAV